MICAKNYEKLSKFVKVTAKILSVLFFWTQCTLCPQKARNFFRIILFRIDEIL